MQKICTWEELKHLSNKKDISIQELKNEDQYHLVIVDGIISYFCKIDTDSDEASEYESDYQFKSNKKVSIIQPSGVKQPDGQRARLMSIHDETISAGTSKNIDWKIENISWLGNNKKIIFDGVNYYCKNGNIGDSVDFQVIDLDGILYPAGTVLEQFATNYKVFPNIMQEVKLYKASLIAGLYIRVIYTSTGTENVHFVCNIHQHIDENKNI